MAGKLFLSDLDDTCGGINWAYRKSIALAYALLVDEIRQKPPEIDVSPYFEQSPFTCRLQADSGINAVHPS